MKFIMLLILFLFQCLGLIKGDAACGNWASYKDEKCFAIMSSNGSNIFRSFEGAKAICNNENAALVQITSAEEQKFLTNLVFTSGKIVDDVWTGLRRVGNGFKWDLDNTDVSYTNWAKDSPSNVTSENCVQMLPKLTNQEGKWDDESCNKKNLVLCQKYQIWSNAVIQKTLLAERKQLEEQAAQIANLRATIQNSIIPIGFTYVQLPKEKAPAEIWPTTGKWQDVSATYAGVFFRVQGGGSAAWGAVQEEDSPRLTKISMTDAKGYVDAGVPIPKGGVGKIKAGITGGPWYFQFLVSNTEVRPKNMAIRIWKRIG